MRTSAGAVTFYQLVALRRLCGGRALEHLNLTRAHENPKTEEQPSNTGVCNPRGADVPNDDELEKHVRETAYFIWLAEGQPQGKERQHWEMARIALEQRHEQRAEREETDTKKLPVP